MNSKQYNCETGWLSSSVHTKSLIPPPQLLVSRAGSDGDLSFSLDYDEEDLEEDGGCVDDQTQVGSAEVTKMVRRTNVNILWQLTMIIFCFSDAIILQFYFIILFSVKPARIRIYVINTIVQYTVLFEWIMCAFIYFISI